LRYSAIVLRLIRENRRLFLGTSLAGLALRLFFFFYFPAVTDDSRIYANLASNWLQHGIYGQTTGAQGLQIVPTDTRLPGYPAFLAGIFWLFGVGNLRAVMLVQILVDLGTCLVIADFARRVASEWAARIAFMLAGLCPFLANYASAVLTETLEVFFTALALDCAAAALNRMRDGERVGWLWAGTGAAIGGCILLRPDGGILLAAVLLYMVGAAKGRADSGRVAAPINRLRTKYLQRRSGTSAAIAAAQNTPVIAAVNRCATQKQAGARARMSSFGSFLVAAIIVTFVALAPLVPWTIRNFRTLHHFQALAPRYANDADELVAGGFNRWVKTWIIDYVSVEEIYWNVPGEKIDPKKLPAHAFDTPEEKDATLAVISDYNDSQDMTADLDARFGDIAAERVRAHPLRYYVMLPVLRVADMWLRPRTELLPPDPRWWQFNDDIRESVTAVGFGLLNLAYVTGALLALFLGKSGAAGGIRWAGMMVIFLLLRSAFLGTMENPEPRYTLEGYPAIIVLASSWLAGGYARFQLTRIHE